MDEIKELFLKKPNKEFHVRGIAKLLKISPTSASKHLKQLENEKLIVSEKKYGHLIFKADTESINYKVQKRNYNLNSIYNYKLINHLQKEYNQPEAIVLFGSYSRGEDTENSDIDLLIISPIKKELKLDKFEKKLERKIQLFVISKEEFKNTNINLKNNWINGIVLEGYIEI